jgi:hypothetical protein
MKVLCERKVVVLLVIHDAQDHNKKSAMREKERKWDDRMGVSEPLFLFLHGSVKFD